MAGFDTCHTPSLRTMQVWRARFSAAGIYIGGENVAFAYGYLSRTWVQTVKAMGWSLLPSWIALWDNRKNVNAPGYLPRSLWPSGDRSKQYSGPRWVKVGGIKLNIDFDLVDGPVVREHHRAPRHHRRKRC